MTGKKDLTSEIARVAYELFEQRGRSHGDHLADWLEAERIVMERHVGEIAAVAATVKKTRLKKATAGTASAAPKSAAARKKKSGDPASEPRSKKRTTAKKQPG